MRHSDYMRAIEGSDPDDWTRLESPVLLHRIEVADQSSGLLGVEPLPRVIAYKQNLSIAIGSGITVEQDFQEPWANGFPNPHASTFLVFFFFNGMPIDQDTYVSVDGGNCVLPMPLAATTQVPASEHAIARLLQNTRGSTRDFDRYFRQAGLTVI